MCPVLGRPSLPICGKSRAGRFTSGFSPCRRIGSLAEIVLKFGAVSYFCEVRLNGQNIGSHEGGYLPFECVAPQALLRPENEIEIDVLLPDGNPKTAPDFPFAEIPHGKQSWYGPLGGIWQSVSLKPAILSI